MFNNSKFKKVLVSTLVFVLLLSTVVVAANNIYEKQLTATHGRIKFVVGGKDVTSEIETKYGSPVFTVREYGDRSYVPLRSIAELMGLEIKYNDTTHTAEIIDAKSQEQEAELKKKNAEIAKLQKDVAKLEKELETYKKTVVEETDIKTLEKNVIKKFGTYKDVKFDIRLKENKNSIAVTMDVDFYETRQQNYWNKMKQSEKKAMLEELTDMIVKEFEGLDITGSIYDKYYKEDLLTFSRKKNSNSVSISYRDNRYDYGYGYDYILDDAEYYLYNSFKSIAKNVYVNVRESNGRITGRVEIDEYGYNDPDDYAMKKAFIYAEDDLINRYGKGVYFDIDLYLNGSSSVYGTYSNGTFK